MHYSFRILNEYRKKYMNLPRSWHIEDAEKFFSLLKQELPPTKTTINEDLCKIFAYVSRGSLSPMHAFIGGLTAQEIMKACTGKFHPIKQFFYFNCNEILPEKLLLNNENAHFEFNLDESDAASRRYKSQIAVLGRKFQNKLQNLNCFLVGSGALGCEYIKNFAMMGVGCGDEGKVTVSDMDTIEKSNLNRQFLFRSWDVQKSKAEVSARAARKMNPSINIEANLNRLGPETEHVYTSEFYESLDLVCNALDNVKTRLYIDSKCIEHQKPLIESGTLGTEGNVQVCVPHLTEAYSSSQDPPEKSTPMCTLKSFPHSIDHTIQWSRDMFEGLFHNQAQTCIKFLANKTEFYAQLSKLKPHHQLDELEQVNLMLKDAEKCNTFLDCVKWARKSWQNNFHNLIKQLLFNIPPDQLTSNNQLFWSGRKRCPHWLEFNAENETHFEYIFSAANLKAYLHCIDQLRDRNKFREILFSNDLKEFIMNKNNEEFRPSVNKKIQLNEEENFDDSLDQDEDLLKLEDFRELLDRNYDRLKQNVKLKPVEFEKDDDENLHMDFVTACSNLRAENYDIKPADKLHVRFLPFEPV
jgi:ubiquitin-activating enzyme E1